uniref:Uncharacterized protein n=1 Tax=Loa loa TaxID=7209 RepID=A0A1I7VRU2_LOALO
MEDFPKCRLVQNFCLLQADFQPTNSAGSAKHSELRSYFCEQREQHHHQKAARDKMKLPSLRCWM